jgi:hypothetical protein
MLSELPPKFETEMPSAMSTEVPLMGIWVPLTVNT